MHRSRILALWLVVLTTLACGRAERSASAPPAPTLSATAALSASATEGYARAIEPRDFVFPADHGPHPDFSTEWWYFTGNLETEGGRRFGYQLTFFRRAVAPSSPERASAWATRQVALAHFALSDIDGDDFHAFERTSRMAVGLAGATAEPLRVWLEDWEVSAADGAEFPWRLSARSEGVAIELELEAVKPLVLQGERGLSRKGSSPGNASYYYSYTRLASRGRIELDGDNSASESFEVEGESWLDREWSTSVLEADQVGWDWFALQLDDGRELMYYQIRRRDPATPPDVEGRLVAANGSSERLSQAEAELEVTARWSSLRGATYPAGWRLRLPARDLELEIRPLLTDQELDVSFRYWEGAVEIRGREGDRPISGRGYVELVGYGE